MTTKSAKSRCAWAESDPLLRDYHDNEWGVQVRNSRALWELLMLEGFQAGLAWITVLRKRDAFRKAFKGFDPRKVARFGEADIAQLLEDPGIIRSRAKIEATIQAARILIEMQRTGEDFSPFLWGIVGGKTIRAEGPIPRKRPSPSKCRSSSRSAASSLSALSSSTLSCRPQVWLTTTALPASAATSAAANN